MSICGWQNTLYSKDLMADVWGDTTPPPGLAGGPNDMAGARPSPVSCLRVIIPLRVLYLLSHPANASGTCKRATEAPAPFPSPHPDCRPGAKNGSDCTRGSLALPWHLKTGSVCSFREIDSHAHVRSSWVHKYYSDLGPRRTALIGSTRA